MRYPIKAARERKNIRSNDVLAVELMGAFDKTFTGYTSRSLSAKIGELDRGKTSWWRKRPSETQHLIDYLDLEMQELGLEHPSGPNLFAFAAFPEFPPLALQREPIWEIGAPKLISGTRHAEHSRYYSKPTLDAWLAPGSERVVSNKIQWLCIPDHVEFQLQKQRLELLSRHQVVSAPNIGTVLDKHIDKVLHQLPLIVIVQDKEAAIHLQTLAAYRQGAPLLVISPWALPELDTSSEPEPEQPVPTLTSADVDTWVWTFLPNWRDVLLDWIEQRMKKLAFDSLFTMDAAATVLNKLDPNHRWFVQVEDVLVLCQAISERREHKLKAAGGSSTDVSALLQLLFNRSESHLELLEEIVSARWERWDLFWDGALPGKEWLALANSPQVFDHLLTRQIIACTADGYDFRRPIVSRLVLRSHLLQQLTHGSLDAWLPACFDDERRPLLDAALDALSISELEAIAVQIRGKLDTLVYIGAAEALYAAIGRRIIRNEDIGTLLPELAGELVPKLHREEDKLYPFSRPLRTAEEALAWITTCWAWSLAATPVNQGASAWLFPGWAKELPAALPDWLTSYGRAYSDVSYDQLTIALRDFGSVVERWLERFGGDAPCYENTSLVLQVGMLTRAAFGAWKTEAYWWSGVIGNPGAEQALLDRVASKDRLDKRAIARAWWPSLVQQRRQEFEQTFHASPEFGSDLFTRNPRMPKYSLVLVWVMEQLEHDAESALRQLDEGARLFLIRHPAALSMPFKRELLKYAARTADLIQFSFEVHAFLAKYGPGCADAMAVFLDHKLLGPYAAALMWQGGALHAERLLTRRRPLSHEAYRNLITTCPPQSLHAALTLLHRQPTLLSVGERRNWAMSKLSDARQHAVELLQMMEAPALKVVG